MKGKSLKKIFGLFTIAILIFQPIAYSLTRTSVSAQIVEETGYEEPDGNVETSVEVTPEQTSETEVLIETLDDAETLEPKVEGITTEVEPAENLIDTLTKEEAVVSLPASEEVGETEWNINADNRTVISFDNVVLNQIYTLPFNTEVSVTFTQLPANPGKLVMKEIQLTEEQIKTTKSLSNFAYEITFQDSLSGLDIENGTFKYNLTLPKPNSTNSVSVEYSESLETLNNFEEIVQKETIESSLIKIENLDHFTVFIVTPENPGDNGTTGVATTLITPNAPGIWNYRAISLVPPATGSTVNFVAGPATPPSGSTGSVELHSGDIGTKGIIYTNSFDGLILNEITNFSYNTYVSNFADSSLAPYINIHLDLDGNGTYDDKIDFYPWRNSPVPLNTWQTWDLMNSQWFNTSTTLTGGNPSDTLANIISNFPNAEIISRVTPDLFGIVVNGGDASTPGWANFTGNIDTITLNTTTYDFEPSTWTIQAPLFWVEEDVNTNLIEWNEVIGANSYNIYKDGSLLTSVSSTQLNFSDNVNGVHTYEIRAVTSLAAESAPQTAKKTDSMDLIIDDNSLNSDLNANGSTSITGVWDIYNVNMGGVVADILQNAIGGDNYSVSTGTGETFMWTGTFELSGRYKVFAQYICDASRGNAQYNVYDGVTLLTPTALVVDQSTIDGSTACGAQDSTSVSGPEWVEIGEFDFTDIPSVELIAGNGEVNIVADAVGFRNTIPGTPTFTGWKKVGEIADENPSVACLGYPEIQWTNNTNKYINKITGSLVTSSAGALKYHGQFTEIDPITASQLLPLQILGDQSTETQFVSTTNYTSTSFTFEDYENYLNVNNPGLNYNVEGKVFEMQIRAFIDMNTNNFFDAGDIPSEWSNSCLVGYDTTTSVITVDNLTTNDPAPVLTGTINDPDASIVITVNGIDYIAINNGSTWTVNVTNALTDGIYNVTASATDIATNTSTDSTTNELTIDLTAPVATFGSINVAEPLTLSTLPALATSALTSSEPIFDLVCIYPSLNFGTNGITAENSQNPINVRCDYRDQAGNTVTNLSSYQILIINQAPTITLNPVTLTINQGEVAGIFVNFITPGNSASYTFNWGGACSGFGNVSSGNLTGLAAGTYACSVNVTDADGDVSNTVSNTIIVNPAPTPQPNLIPLAFIAASPSTSVTTPTVVTLTAIVQSGDLPLASFQWFGACTGTGQTTTVPSAVGSYICGVNVTDANGDVTNNSQRTISITVLPEGSVLGASTVNSGSTTRPNGVGNSFGETEEDEAEVDEEEDTEDEGNVLGDETCSEDEKNLINGYAFINSDGNSSKDSSENGIPSLKIRISFEEEDGALGLLEEVTTNNDGYWEAKTCPGKYTVEIIDNNFPENTKLTSINSREVNLPVNADLENIDFLFEEENDSSFNPLLILLPLLALLIIGLIIYSRRRKEPDHVI